MGVIDQPGGNPAAQLTAEPHLRPRVAYPWVCTNPTCPGQGQQQIGFVERGCQFCGVGADGIPGKPLSPTDFTCRACKGAMSVERRCGDCRGTGIAGAAVVSEGEAAADCESCGGTGVLGVNCPRCKGSGLDPEPRQVEEEDEMDRTKETNGPTTQQVEHLVARAAAAPRELGPSPSETIFQLPQPKAALPSLDDLTPRKDRGEVVRRYRLICYEGREYQVDEVIRKSLDGHWERSDDWFTITAIEIAPPTAPSIELALETARRKGLHWPAKFE